MSLYTIQNCKHVSKSITYFYLLLFIFFAQGTWKLAKCSDCVQNGYGGDSEIVTIIIIIKYIFVNTTVLTA